MTVIAGRYRVLGTLGSGGMAEVLAANDERLGRDVAIKLIRPELLTDPSSRERLLREARAAAALHHPNTVTVFDTGDDDGRPYIVMQLIDGESLADRLRAEAPLPLEETIEIGMAVLAGLAAAHADGIVHRDVKPSNVLLSSDGDIKLADFGIAKALDSTDPGLTTTGAMLGTPRYLSPEQAAGRPATPASDQYSLGAVLYECLAGRPPFQGDSAVAVALAHQQQAPEPLTEIAPHVPPSIAAVVQRALAKDPADRFADVSEMGAALADAATGGTAHDGADGSGYAPATSAAATVPMVGAFGDPPPGGASGPGSTTPSASGAGVPSRTQELTASSAGEPDGAGGGASTFHPGRTRLWWALGIGVLVLLLAVAVLPGLLGGDDDGGAADPDPPPGQEQADASDPGDDPDPADEAGGADDGGAQDDEVEEGTAGGDDTEDGLPTREEALARLDELIAELAGDPDAAGQHGNQLLRALMDVRDEEDTEDQAEDARELVRDIASRVERDQIELSYAEAVVPVLAAIGTPEGEGLDEVAELFAQVAVEKETWGNKAKDLLDDLDDLIGEDAEDRAEDAADIIDEIDEWIEKDELDPDRGRHAQDVLERFIASDG